MEKELSHRLQYFGTLQAEVMDASHNPGSI